MISLGQLSQGQVREALRLLGVDPPAGRAAACRELADTLSGYGTVRAVLERAPDGARTAFVRLADDGALTVQDLLGRGWWGRGLLPPPLDWLQRRALVGVGDDGLVHVVSEAHAGFHALTLDVAAPPPPEGSPLRVEPAGCVVVAPDADALDRAVAVEGAALQVIAATVAVSDRGPEAVSAALRAAGVRLDEDEVVPARPHEPALPSAQEAAVGPRAVRALLERATVQGRQVRLQYFASSRGGTPTDRVVDPWEFRDDLLRGWCHLRRDERTFAVDRVGRAVLLPSPLSHHPDDGGAA